MSRWYWDESKCLQLGDVSCEIDLVSADSVTDEGTPLSVSVPSSVRGLLLDECAEGVTDEGIEMLELRHAATQDNEPSEFARNRGTRYILHM